MKAHNIQFSIQGRVIYKQIETAPFQRFTQVARIIAGEKNHGLVDGGYRPDFRDADLKVAEDFQQKCFKFDVGPIDLVN